MLAGYRGWLEQQKYQAATIAAQLHRAGRVEKAYLDLDEHYDRDQLASVINALTYTADDKRRNRPNPSKIDFHGDVLSNLAAYRNAVERYRKFRQSSGDADQFPAYPDLAPSDRPEENDGQRIGLERDLQAALRLHVDQLEKGLKITDEGAERSVNSGFIDITGRDGAGHTVVIELKAGTAGPKAIAQILSYMGDVATEEETEKVRGILVASDFDKRAKAAARMVPNLALRSYRVKFLFSDEV